MLKPEPSRSMHVSIKEFSDAISDNTTYYEETGNWRNIIFLPYKMLTRVVVMLTSVLNCYLVCYIILFQENKYSYTWTIYYVFEWMYFLNTGLVLLHRFMRYRRTRSHIPKSVFLLVLDVISLIPYYETYYLIKKTSHGDGYNFTVDYTRVKVFLRLFTVFVFFLNANNEPGLNHILATTALQLVCFSLYSVIFSGLWYMAGKEAREGTWMINLKYHYFNNQSDIHWWVICNNFITNIYVHNWSGVLTSENNKEHLLVVITMLAGYFIHIVFYSMLTSLFIKQISDQYYFSYRLFVITKLLNSWKVSNPLKKTVISVYNTFWEKRFGRSKMPASFYVDIPLSLQKEVCLDTYWHFFRHSHFFNDTDMVFNRNLSLYMKCSYFMPGEYLYAKAEMKDKIVYIVSGVIQLLSKDDQNSPVISFSSGTVLGEISCIMIVPCLSNLRCATYCEVQILELRTLAYAMVNFNNISNILWSKLNARLEVARRLQHPELVKLKARDENRTSIRWFKSQWRFVSEMARHTKRPGAPEDRHRVPITPQHFSKYLNLYALSDEVELKVKTICLKSECPMIMHPKSGFRSFCEYVMLFVIVIQCGLLPYYLVFNNTLKDWQLGLFYSLDVFYIVGLYLDISTAIETKERFIANMSEIVLQKIKSIKTIVDIVATIPVELFISLITDNQRLVDLLHLNRLLKMHKLYWLMRDLQLNVWVNYMKIRIFKYFLWYTIAVYMLSSLVYGMVCFVECSKTGWFFYNRVLSEMLAPIIRIENPSPFVRSIHYTSSTLMMLTWRQYFSYSILDMVTELLIGICGYYLISFCFAEICACAVMNLKHESDYREYFNSLKYFCFRNNIANKLTEWMYKAVDTRWIHSNGFETYGPGSVIKHMPNYLKHSIITVRIINCLKLVPLFWGCNENCLKELASVARVQIFPPGMAVVRTESRTFTLHIILNGCCKAESTIPTDKYHESYTILKYGACFPLMEALLNIDNFLNITAETHLELISFDINDIMHKLKHFSDMHGDLVAVLAEHQKENKIVLSRQKGRLPSMVSYPKSQGRGEFFQYKCIDGGTTDEEDATQFDNVFKRLGKWKFIRHMFLPRTIEPTSTKYIWWEFARCIVSTVQIAYTLLFMKFSLMTYSYAYVEMLFFCLAFVDFYIRMHVRYYNDLGILVTHPLYTAGHYLSTSFASDLAGVFPFQTLKVHRLFGNSTKLHTLMILCMCTRPVLLYRVYKGICYAQSRVREGVALFFENLKYAGLVIVVIGALALILEGLTCTTETENMVHVCPNDSWIINHNFLEEYKPHTTSFISYYVAFSIFATAPIGTFEFTKNREMMVLHLFTVLLFGMKWFVLAKITSAWIGGNMILIRYQHNMEVFLHFGRRNHINSDLINEIVSHNEYIWETTRGGDVSQILRSIHTVLSADFGQFLYAQYLSLSEIFYDAPPSAIRYMCHHCKEKHHKKDSYIIRCNDINDILYIVCKGQVEVRVADCKLCRLGPGGIFGCLIPYGATRQTITVRTNVHTTVLAIQSSKFTEGLNNFPAQAARMRRARILATEYLLPKFHSRTRRELKRAESTNVVPSKLTLVKKNRFLIHADNIWYQAFNYIVNVHLAVLSSLMVMLLISKVGEFDIAVWNKPMYVLDVFYCTKIIIGFHLTYFDTDTGILVINHDLIFRKYVRSWNGFWLDLFTVLPTDFCFYWSTNHSLYRAAWVNRVFRCTFMFQYYRTKRNRLTVSKYQRWIYLMYIVLLLVHLTTCIWWLVACPEERCIYNKIMNHEPFEHKIAVEPMYGFWLCIKHVINIFTATGLKDMSANTCGELAASMIMITTAQVTVVVLTIGVANMLVLQKFLMTEYETKAKHILLFSQAINVSTSLKTKVWSYFVELWTRSYGAWLPDLVRYGPKYLKEAIMVELYGWHLTTHYIFMDVHVDLLRQIVACVEPRNFMPGMYIAEKGDVDAAMYFIIKGEIIVYEKHGNNEIEQNVLGRGKSFGELQGIYGFPHDRSYKARFQCQLLVLKRESWYYLLRWFPASREKIQESMMAHFKKAEKLVV